MGVKSFSFKEAIEYGRRIFLSNWFYQSIKIVVAFVFVYSGFIKLTDLKTFAGVISEYNLVPEGLLPPVVIGLPVLELLAGLGLIFNIRGSLGVIFGLLITFVTVLWYGILKDLNIDCGCFSEEELRGQASLWRAFYRDLVIIGGVLYLYLSRWLKNSRKSTFSLLAKIKSD
ncbi:MAG: MauE/DoxX family redox-associated membrane protein [Nitrospirota bacterium]